MLDFAHLARSTSNPLRNHKANVSARIKLNFQACNFRGRNS
jgi:hypothetical protein